MVQVRRSKRVRYNKAKNKVKNKKEVNQQQNDDDDKNKKLKIKPKTERKPIPSTKKIDNTTIDAVFPLFKTIKYKLSIHNIHSIHSL